MFERETHREKIMEARLREIKLKIRTKTMPALNEQNDEMNRAQAAQAHVQAAEEEFYKIIEEEKNPEVSEPADGKEQNIIIIFFSIKNIVVIEEPEEPEIVEPEPSPIVIIEKKKTKKKGKKKL